MKKNVMMRVASALLVAVLMTTCAISGTFAKYTTSATGSDTARVAKWDIKLDNASMTNTFNFDLFETILDTDTDAEETDVKKAGAGEAAIIAPGTKGSFEIILENDSEVTAEYTIDYTVTNTNNIPVKFSVDGGTTWTADLADVTAPVTLAMDAAAKTITVQWKWDFEVNADGNTVDTNLGTAATAAVLTVEAKVTVNQVD